MGKLKHAALERNTERRRSSVEMIMGHIQTISSRVTFKDKYAGPSDRPAGSSGEAGGEKDRCKEGRVGVALHRFTLLRA